LKIIDPETLDDKGRMMLFYGETGVGKTLSILASAPKPLLWIPTERKDVKKNRNLALEIGKLDKDDIKVAYYEDWLDTMEFISDPSNLDGFACVFIDGLTHLMSIDLLTEIENQSVEGMKKSKDMLDKIRTKPLAYLTKGGQENYGALESCTKRLIAALTRLHESGKCVIFSALLDENPKWDRDLSASPLIAGRAVSKSLPIFFGTIGLVQPVKNKAGELTYPPGVRLISEDGDFVARYTGKPNSKGRVRLDVQKILSL
jgi:hypothetical protein